MTHKDDQDAAIEALRRVFSRSLRPGWIWLTISLPCSSWWMLYTDWACCPESAVWLSRS